MAQYRREIPSVSTAIRRGSLATFSLLIASGVCVGCSQAEGELPVWDAIESPLTGVLDEISDGADLYVQDASPRVGLEASYSGDAESGSWVVVAACADRVDIAAASTVEFAVIPQVAVTDEVRARIKDGDFLNAVWCEGRHYRA